MTNEAAERLVADGLRQRMGWGAADPRYVRTMQDVREALAAERRATVEKVRHALEADLDIKVTGTFWRRMAE